MPHPSSKVDTDLLRMLRDGNAVAFGKIYEIFAPILYQRLLRLLKDTVLYQDTIALLINPLTQIKSSIFNLISYWTKNIQVKVPFIRRLLYLDSINHVAWCYPRAIGLKVSRESLRQITEGHGRSQLPVFYTLKD